MPITRRNALQGGLTVAAFGAASLNSHLAFAQCVSADPLWRDAVLSDPAIPRQGILAATSP